MTMTQGYNFRSTAAYVTDGANCQPVATIGYTILYPTTAAAGSPSGNTYGWVSGTGVNVRNRSTTIDPRLAGVHYVSAAATQTFRADLPAAGSYAISLAIGDESFSVANAEVKIYDGATLLATIGPLSIAAGHFVDATGTTYTAAAWPGSNTAATFTFAGTELLVTIGSGITGSQTSLAHVFIQSAGGPINTPLALQALGAANAAIGPFFTGKSMLSTAAQASLLGRGTGRNIGSTGAATGLLTRGAQRTFQAIGAETASLLAHGAYARAIQAGAAQSSSARRAVAIVRPAQAAQTSALIRQAGKSGAAVASQVVILQLGPAKMLPVGVSASASEASLRVHLLAALAQAATAITLLRAMAQAHQAQAVAAAGMTRQTSRLAAAIGATAATMTTGARTFSYLAQAIASQIASILRLAGKTAASVANVAVTENVTASRTLDATAAQAASLVSIKARSAVFASLAAASAGLVRATGRNVPAGATQATQLLRLTSRAVRSNAAQAATIIRATARTLGAVAAQNAGLAAIRVRLLLIQALAAGAAGAQRAIGRSGLAAGAAQASFGPIRSAKAAAAQVGGAAGLARGSARTADAFVAVAATTSRGRGLVLSAAASAAGALLAFYHSLSNRFWPAAQFFAAPGKPTDSMLRATTEPAVGRAIGSGEPTARTPTSSARER